MTIQLKEGSTLKDRAIQGTLNTYQFYSITDFNLTINRIYGNFEITVKDPSSTTQISNQEASKDHE